MTRLAFVVVVLVAFLAIGHASGRHAGVPPAWKVRLISLALLGTFGAAILLLTSLMIPELLWSRSLHGLWSSCAEFVHRIVADPQGHASAAFSAVLLLVVLGRFSASIGRAAVVTRKARLTRGTASGGLEGTYPLQRISSTAPTAFATGYLAGRVVVSDGLVALLDRSEVQAVLSHEEAHLRARHNLLLLVSRAATAALVPVLPLRSLCRRLEQAMEEAADDAAVASVGSRAVVAGALSKVALAQLDRPAGAVAVSGSDVPARVRRLLEPNAPPGWMPAACLVASGVLSVVFVATQLALGGAFLLSVHHALGVGIGAFCPLSGHA